MNPKWLFILLALFFLNTEVWTQEYQIQFHRAYTVGSRLHSVSHGRVKRETANLIQGVRSEETSSTLIYHIEGVATIQEVDTKGQPQKVDFLVSKFTSREEGSEGEDVEVLAEGTTITYWFENGDVHYQVDGDEASEEVKTHARPLFDLPPPDEFTFDDIWGVEEPKKVGDFWDANIEKLTEEFEVFDFKVNPGAVRSRMSLINANERDGVPSLEFEWNLTVPETKCIVNSDDDLKIQAKIQERGRMIYPQDPKHILSHTANEIIIFVRMETGAPNEYSISRVETNIENTFRYLPEEADANP